MEKLISEISRLYGLQLHSSEKIDKGFLTENHILWDDHNKYFLKRYRFNRQDRIEEIHFVKKYFADGGIPVILPIINIQRSTYFIFENSFFALFPFISDTQLEKRSLTDIAVISLGEMLGKIHLLGKTSKILVKEKFEPWNREKALNKIEKIFFELNMITNRSEFDKLALDSITMKKKLIEANQIIYHDLALSSDHLIHGDYLDHNVFFGKDDKVSYVFDFEKANYSPRMYELFRSLAYIFLSDEVGEKELMQSKLYLDSYLSIYPTSKDELQRGLKLFYLKSIHGTWVEGEHYLNKNDRADELLRNDFHRVNYLSRNIEKLRMTLF